MSAPAPGQVWRRKADGSLTTVLSLTSVSMGRPGVMHRGRRRTITGLRSFLSKYELTEVPA